MGHNIDHILSHSNLAREPGPLPLPAMGVAISALLNGKIEAFRLDGLVDMAHRLGLHVSLDVAA